MWDNFSKNHILPLQETGKPACSKLRHWMNALNVLLYILPAKSFLYTWSSRWLLRAFFRSLITLQLCRLRPSMLTVFSIKSGLGLSVLLNQVSRHLVGQTGSLFLATISPKVEAKILYTTFCASTHQSRLWVRFGHKAWQLDSCSPSMFASIPVAISKSSFMILKSSLLLIPFQSYILNQTNS